MIVRDYESFRHPRFKPPFRLDGPRPSPPNLQLIVLLIYGLTVLGTMAGGRAAAADAPPIVLAAPMTGAQLASRIDYYLDDAWREDAAGMLGPNAGLFQPLGKPAADFGYIKSAVWLRLRLTNAAADEARWLLYFRENFKQYFTVYVAYPDGRIRTTFHQDLETGFGARPIAYPELVAPIPIPPGETVTVLVRYWSEGASYLPVQIETPTSFAAIAAKRIAKNYLYYGVMALLLFGALVALIVFRHGVFLAYFCYAGSTLLYLMHADGVAYQHLWPDFPRFNSAASILTGSMIILSGAVYARLFLRTRALHPVLDKLLLALIAATLAIDAASLVADNQPIKRLLILVALAACVLFTLSGLVAARQRFIEVRFYVFAWGGAMLSALLMTARHWFGIEVSQDFQFDSMRIVMLFDATMMGMAIVDRYNQMRRSRQQALNASLRQARQNLELSARLQQLEAQVTLADELAQSRDHALADTIHDLRQPLGALRLRIHGVLKAEGEPKADRQEIDAAFNYLESLVNERLAGAPPAPAGASALAAPDPDRLTLPAILAAVHEMFLPDAAEKGLTFRLVTTTADLAAPPLPLMRILTNLVANAIKYTDTGGLLLGVRRRGQALSIEVHDTGPGLTAEAFIRAQGRTIRLDAATTEGHGLGLAIARDLAEQNGWRLELAANRRTGSGVALVVGGVGG